MAEIAPGVDDCVPHVDAEPDPVKAPAHYAGDGGVDCARAMRSMAAGYDEAGVPAGVSYWMLSALKYVWRAPLKNGGQDVRKAMQCLEYALDEMSGVR